MSILPLPVFEADADPSRRAEMTDEEILARLRPPTSIVVKFGAMRLIGEYPYDGDAKPGCGSKLVVRTVRGTEMAEMLTTTCSNSGCGKSISRKEMLEYVEASGGKDYPFQEHGRVLRVATLEDMNRWSAIQSQKPAMLRQARDIATAAGMTIKLVDVEPILGGETTLIYYLSEERIDFRDAVKELAVAFGSRIDMRQVGARDEARLVADYERCGQHCCCRNFLKVLKPVSMRSAKVQKATLDPLKISGRCGRLMCCLRYEDETYTDLKARLPKLKTRVGTSEGPGFVIDGKILVQLVLVRLEHDGREIAVPVEELMDPEKCPPPGSVARDESDPLRGADPRAVARRTRDRREPSARRDGAEPRTPIAAPASPKVPVGPAPDPKPDRSPDRADSTTESSGERKRRKRRGRGREESSTGSAPTSDRATEAFESTPPVRPEPGPDGDASTSGESTDTPRKKRRRRRKSRDPGHTPADQQDAFRAASQAEERGESPDTKQRESEGTSKRKRRRRRRGKKEGGASDGGGAGSGDGGGDV